MNLPTNPMLLIKTLRIFVQKDTNQSLQRKLVVQAGNSSAGSKEYQKIISIADKVKFQKNISFKECLFAAQYYRSLKNELSGRTLRYESFTTK